MPLESPRAAEWKRSGREVSRPGADLGKAMTWLGVGAVMPCQRARTELARLLEICGEVRTSVPHLVRGKLGILDLSNFYTGTIFGAPPLLLCSKLA